MAQLIESADLVRYNANNRGNDVGDCVCRTISFAFDVPYSDAGKQLNAMMKVTHRTKWNIAPVYNLVIEQYGGGKPITVPEGQYPTVEEFADENPNGCFIIVCGKNSSDARHSHMVCIIDGKIYDSWDSRPWFVKIYYTCSGERHVVDTGLQSHMKELSEYARDLTFDELQKYLKKWLAEQLNITSTVEMRSGGWEGLLIKMIWRVEYEIGDDTKAAAFNISVPLKPGMTEDEARAFILKTCKTRAYDRIYALKADVKKDLEAYDAVASAPEDAPVADQRWLYTSAQEDRFIKNLPGKIRPYISYIRIYAPGQYSNSYELKIKRMPGDPNPEKSFTIEAYEASAAKDMVKRYVEKFERPYDDYSPYEDY